jgi:hypothetical protein
MELKDCFTENFTQWLLKSNNLRVGYSAQKDRLWREVSIPEDRFKDMLAQVEEESLQEILDILLREPLADYFWYTYRENGGRLTYASLDQDVVPNGAIRVDKEKIKIFLRDIKIETILQRL